MPSRARTSWRQAAGGQYTRQIGWTTSRTGTRVQAKCRLGANLQDAKRRDQIIRTWWGRIEASPASRPPCWTDEALAAAKTAAATGRAVIRPAKQPDEEPEQYVHRLVEMRSELVGVQVE